MVDTSAEKGLMSKSGVDVEGKALLAELPVIVGKLRGVTTPVATSDRVGSLSSLRNRSLSKFNAEIPMQ